MNINDVALRRLSSRNRTVMEMRRYLTEKGFPLEEVEETIKAFTEYGYLNDGQYCLEYFQYAFAKGKGKQRVQRELIQKGVSQEVILQAFDEYEVEIDELAMARKEAEKILRMVDLPEDEPIPEKIMGRIARRLATYGYGSDVVYRIIGELRK
ncbi:SOS response regulatory protein OraA/RecX [Clostridiales Family XIII bacterium PM5-7]